MFVRSFYLRSECSICLIPGLSELESVILSERETNSWKELGKVKERRKKSGGGKIKAKKTRKKMKKMKGQWHEIIAILAISL